MSFPNNNYTDNKLKVAILGSGNIGSDLLIKVMRSKYLKIAYFIGHKINSPGIQRAKSLNVRISDRSIDAIKDEPDCCDLVFDATSALDHKYHWSILEKLGKFVVDMTPSQIGSMIIPAVNLSDCIKYRNINMVTCGGQASIPLAHAIGRVHDEVEYIEVVSSLASKSAGPATRINIDEYVETTEEGLKVFGGCKRSKAILILNPADPCVNMQTTISAKVKNPDIKRLAVEVAKMVEKIQFYVPGYKLIVPPVWETNRIVIIARVIGLGDYLPTYAGNMDIINCAAIAAAEEYAKITMNIVQKPE